MENNVARYEKQVAAFLEATQSARTLAEKVRDYTDLIQWTEEQKSELAARKQAAVVFDYMREQLDYLLGLDQANRRDPRAFPRTKKHEEATDACTDALRYVADKNDFQELASDGYEDLLGQGYEVAIIEAVEAKDEYDITIQHVPWDRFYYDPHSRRKDFKDSAYMGLMVWLDESDAIALYKGKAKDIADRLSTDIPADQTFDEKLSWIDKDRKRIRVCQHYFREGGKWMETHFGGGISLIDPKPCSYLDQNGEPECPIEAQAAYVNRKNERYGYLARMLDPQDEVNHRRSKGLFLLSSRQVIYEEGAVTDIDEFTRELKKPDGKAKANPGALTNNSLQISQTGDMASGQVEFYRDAVNKMDRTGANAAMQGDVSGMSGVAVGKLQAGGGIQLGPVKSAHSAWKRRIYRQVWNRIRQFWDAPMWIRVTDDENNLQFVGLNQPVTVRQQMEEAAKKGDQEAAQMLQEAIAANDPRLDTVIDTRNNVAEIDVDIILDESPDTINAQEEQFSGLLELGKVYGAQEVPFAALIELSAMRNKRKVLDLLKGDNEQAAMQQQMQAMQKQLQDMAAQVQLALGQAKVEKTKAETAQIDAKTQQTNFETKLAATVPDLTPNVNL